MDGCLDGMRGKRLIERGLYHTDIGQSSLWPVHHHISRKHIRHPAVLFPSDSIPFPFWDVIYHQPSAPAILFALRRKVPREELWICWMSQIQFHCLIE
jgi:hypothetical protein